MSALGQKRTLTKSAHVRFTPQSGHRRQQIEYSHPKRCHLPNRKGKKSHIEIRGCPHAERSVERIYAITDPESNTGANKYNRFSEDKAHLSGGRVHTKGHRCNEKQNELLQRIVNDTAINPHSHVFLLQCRINGVAKKAGVSHRQDAEQERNYSKGIGLNGI